MTMQDNENPTPVATKRIPWNKGKLTGAKPPLQPKHVWSIRTKLQMAERKRDLALFNFAIDSKLRACDVIALKVEDIAPHGYAIERATVRQTKTDRPVRFEVTEQTRQAVDDYLRVAPLAGSMTNFTAPSRRAATMTFDGPPLITGDELEMLAYRGSLFQRRQAAGSLKALAPKRPIREADIELTPRDVRFRG
jgi:integrase